MRTITLLSLLFLLFSSSPIKGQANGEDDQKNCFEKYVEAFERRGAKKVEDTVHEEVVVTIRKGERGDCFMGKAEVKDGIVVKTHLMVEDSTYERMTYDYKHEEVKAEIVNGVSRTKVTEDEGKLVNVLFIDHMKPKQKEYIRAPEPDFD